VSSHCLGIWQDSKKSFYIVLGSHIPFILEYNSAEFLSTLIRERIAVSSKRSASVSDKRSVVPACDFVTVFVNMAMSPQCRIVVIAVDNSEFSEKAFDCE
jgi:hypothetical protein